MKISLISFLILIAFPFQLMAQESESASNQDKKVSNYFIHSPLQIDTSAKHLVQRSNKSNRKTTNAPQVMQLEQQQPPAVSKTPTTVSESPSSIQQATKLQVVQEVLEGAPVAPPQVSSEAFNTPNNVTRPTPVNSEPVAVQSPEPIVETMPVNQSNQEMFRADASVEPERISLDHLRMSQRERASVEKPHTMRDIVDNFSPGGEPFADRGLVNNPNFFGVDRYSCCDEWAGYCNCSGGLKVNPGHLGIPWLRNKENCDSAEPVNCRRRTRRSASGCGCSQCGGN